MANVRTSVSGNRDSIVGIGDEVELRPAALRQFGQRQGLVNEFVAERFGASGILLRDEGDDFAQFVLRLRG